jgi:hypothetical protein
MSEACTLSWFNTAVGYISSRKSTNWKNVLTSNISICFFMTLIDHHDYLNRIFLE